MAEPMKREPHRVGSKGDHRAAGAPVPGTRTTPPNRVKKRPSGAGASKRRTSRAR
jgi:hypothetical protein